MPQVLLWQDLPSEVWDLILMNLLVDEYLDLYDLVEGPFKEFLNDSTRFNALFHMNYGKQLEAFEWGDANLLPDSYMVHRLNYLNEVEKIMRRIHQLNLPDPSSDDPKYSPDNYPPELMTSIVELSCKPEYKLVSLHHAAQQEEVIKGKLAAAALDPGNCMDINLQEASWALHLAHMQQFSQSVQFFRDSEAKCDHDLERCHFELARCRADFSALAPFRTKVLNQIRKRITDFNSSYSKRLRFQSRDMFHGYLRTICLIITRCLPFKTIATRQNQNDGLLGFYSGQTIASMNIVLAVIAKILQEEMFDKFILEYPQTVLKNIVVKVSQLFIIAGDTIISIGPDYSASVYAIDNVRSNYHWNDFSPICYIDAVENAYSFHKPESELFFNDPNELSTRDWSPEKSGPGTERLRFVRLLLLWICNRSRFELSEVKPIMQSQDFYHYFSCMRYHLEAYKPSNFGIFLKELKPKKVDPSERHPLVINWNQRYIGAKFGVMRRPDPSGTRQDIDLEFLIVFPFDNIEPAMTTTDSFKLLKPADFGARFAAYLYWVICSEGGNYLTRYCQPNLEITEGQISLYFDRNNIR